MKKCVRCGNVEIGGTAPVSIQSMLNVPTADVRAAVIQIEKLKEAGCDIIRLSVPDQESAEAFGKIKQEVVHRYGEKAAPLVADIHFDYRLAVSAIKNGADKIRINPGNIGELAHIKAVTNAAKERSIPIRIGVNSGSLEKDILERDGKVTAKGIVESAIRNVKLLEGMDFDDIVVSIKSSSVPMTFEAYRMLDQQTDYPLHIGITESGIGDLGRIKSAIGIGALLLSGIGNTMRVSITGDPALEVQYAKEILEIIGLRSSGIDIISCPTCGRTKVDLEKIVEEISKQLIPIKNRRNQQGKRRMTIAVMGCAVNGPGEASDADLGVACGEGKGVIFSKGKIVTTVAETEIITELMKRAEDFEDI